MEKQRTYWIEGENGEGHKVYFTGIDAGERLLQFLQDNDPIVCGSDLLEPKTIEKLNALGDDGLLPAEELV